MNTSALSLRVLVLQEVELESGLVWELEQAGHRVTTRPRREDDPVDHCEFDLVLHEETSHGSPPANVRIEGGNAVLGAGEEVTREHVLARVDALSRLPTLRRGVPRKPPPAPSLLGLSLRRMQEQIDAFAQSDAPVLVLGETGTGKELVARALHDRSPRAAMPFMALNCAAMPETLLESELFGHEPGAFTGAMGRRPGRLMAAHRGTFFLDEVAELPVSAGAKLLRALELGIIDPLGSDASARVDVRFIAATHRDLRQRVDKGLFRQDLYYRLKVLEIRIPPLRNRPEDLDLLVHTFLRRYSRAWPRLSIGAWRALRSHHFPGNVRELEHAIQHAAVLAGDEPVEPRHLPVEMREPAAASAQLTERFLPLARALQDFERGYLVRALARAGSSRTRAAKLLGISRKSLWEKMRRLGIDPDRVAPAAEERREGAREDEPTPTTPVSS